MKGSLIILSFFAAGLLLGVYRVMPASWLDYDYSFYVLAALMFSVGFSLGHQPDTIQQFRRIHSRVLFLPLMTIVGTWLGVVVISFFPNVRFLIFWPSARDLAIIRFRVF